MINLTAKTKRELFSSRSLIAAQAGMNAIGLTFIVGLATFVCCYFLKPQEGAACNTFIVVLLWSVFVSPMIIMYCAAEDWVKLGELHKKLNTTVQEKIN